MCVWVCFVCVVSISLWSVTLAERVKVDAQVCVWVCVGSDQRSPSPNRRSSPQQGSAGARGSPEVRGWKKMGHTEITLTTSVIPNTLHLFNSFSNLSKTQWNGVTSSFSPLLTYSYWNRKLRWDILMSLMGLHIRISIHYHSHAANVGETFFLLFLDLVDFFKQDSSYCFCSVFPKENNINMCICY